MRTVEADEPMRFPVAFMLLTQVARRARRSDELFNPHGLELGEALLGDHQSIGASEQKYRTAKIQLEKWGFATFRPTNKGTVAKLLDARVYDINAMEGNDLTNGQITFQSTTQTTTKKKLMSTEEGKKEKEETRTGVRSFSFGFCLD